MTIGFKKAVAESRDLSFELRGMVALPEKADLKADLYIHPKVAAALIARVPDLESLRDEQANIYLPVNITGALAKPLVMPDIEYLSKKLLVGRGAQQLKKVLGDIPEVQGVLNSLFGAPKDGR
jgi:hypothetical protein